MIVSFKLTHLENHSCEGKGEHNEFICSLSMFVYTEKKIKLLKLVHQRMDLFLNRSLMTMEGFAKDLVKNICCQKLSFFYIKY